MQLRPLLVALLLPALAGVAGIGCSRPPVDVPAGAPPASAWPAASRAGRRALEAGGIVTTADGAGRPRFIRALAWPDGAATPPRAGASPELAAREHLGRFAGAYGLAAEALDALVPDPASRTPRGDLLVRFRQRVGGVDVYGGDIKVAMRSDLSLVALSGTPSDIVQPKPADAPFRLGPGEALGRALQYHFGVAVAAGVPAALPPGDAADPHQWLDLPPGGEVQLSGPARARRVYYRSGERLVSAYAVEFFASRGPRLDSEAQRYLVAAADGRVLERHDLGAHAAFNYRVFAEAAPGGRPLDGPTLDFSPHPTGRPDGSNPPFATPALVSVESLKATPRGFVDPWLPAGATQTLGNNVDAYADLFAPDGYSNGDLRATATATRTFDRVYDTAADPAVSVDQTMAATTNLFYLVNWLHDYWYDSGFDEAAGNGQANNFGRGGLGGDALRAEAQDIAGLNNANMQVPSDGFAPRMQMYLWLGPETRAFSVEPGALAFEYEAAAFGPTRFDVSAPLALAPPGAGAGPIGDACQALAEPLAGRIALVQRGNCDFVVKAANVEAAGAVAMVVANNVAGPPVRPGGTAPIQIPVVGITLEDGERLAALLGAASEATGEVRARLLRQPGLRKDGSLDNIIVAHEWGHYFHHRLSHCVTFQCRALSEGWSDFVALHTILRAGDDLDGAFAIAPYGTRDLGDAYFGLRRVPYSVDFAKNALTLRHVQNGEALPDVPSVPFGDNSDPHNAGEVWASMLFEAYVALQRQPGERSFDEVRRAFADYVVLGLQLAPPNATFTETRDALLTAVAMAGEQDVVPVAEAFARRGAGSCAAGPAREATEDLAPVTETFAVQPSITLASLALDDTADTCDGDGILDAGETGRLRVAIANPGPVPLVDTRVTVSSAEAGVVFPAGASVILPLVPAMGSASVTLEVGLDAKTPRAPGVLTLAVTASNPSACTPEVNEPFAVRVHVDEVEAASSREDVETRSPPWGKTGAAAASVWSRAEVAADQHVFLGLNLGAVTDTQLVSPPLEVGAGASFRVSFTHAYGFEADADGFWDGAVIELSSDDGATWTDLATWADPGYQGVINEGTGNALAGRRAFTGRNPSYPNLDRVNVDLGGALAGRTVRLRFRIGTDASAAGLGWLIDDVAVEGLVNRPFGALVPHAGNCQAPPVAAAGPDRTVTSGADVILDGSASRDPNGDPVTYRWSQTSGPAVAILNPTSAVAAFRAPEVKQQLCLGFKLVVADAGGAASDEVIVTVKPGRRRGGRGGGGALPESEQGPVAASAGAPPSGSSRQSAGGGPE